MTSQTQNQANSSADTPQPYGVGEGAQGSDRFAQGGQYKQENWGTEEGANVGSRERQQATYNTSTDTNTSDTFQGKDDPTSHRVGEHPLSGDPEGAFSGASGGGGLTESSMQQTQTPPFEKEPGTASLDAQRTSTGTGAQHQSDSKVESGTQFGGQASTTAAVGEGGTAASGTAGTAPGTGPKGLKNIVSGVQGAGEAIRGKMMQGVDEAFGHEAGVEKNREIAQAGMEKMRSGFGIGQGNAPSVGGENKGTAPGVGGYGENKGTVPEAGGTGENQGTASQSGGTGPREAGY